MVNLSRPFFELGEDGAASKVKGIVTADVSLEWLTSIVSSVSRVEPDIVLSLRVQVTSLLTPIPI